MHNTATVRWWAWSHNTCNILGCKILWGPRPVVWDQESLCLLKNKTKQKPWSIQESHTPSTNCLSTYLSPITFPHTFHQSPFTSHLSTPITFPHQSPFTNHLSTLITFPHQSPFHIPFNQNKCTIHLHAMHFSTATALLFTYHIVGGN